ncbi:MAG: NAD(P)-binding protein [Planctomycetes bacterium]|nr:NAD(P)-binding protein [Planctomycetota bacterium]
MALLIHNLALGLDEPTDALAPLAARKMRIDPERIRSLRIARKSLDARPNRMRWVYSVIVDTDVHQPQILRRTRGADVQAYSRPASPRVHPGQEKAAGPPVVVGTGPAGLFAALLLAQAGYRPLVLDRGRDVDRRDADVRAYVATRTLNPESNFVFGEGGAGAYSDGKLYTRTRDPLAGWLLEQFVAFGADPEVAVSGKPHVGSDRLPAVSRAMRQRIEGLGGTVRWEARVDGLEIADGAVRAVRLADGERIAAGSVLLGVGHSARDTFAMLAGGGIGLSAKTFQMGLRIEHPQAMIDRVQYGEHAGRADLGASDYHLVARGAAGDGDLYTFCMCPGGRVLPTNHQPGTLCTNGGSNRLRDSGWANAGLVIGVSGDRFGGDPLEGLALQERIERACFAAACGTYALAAQRAEDFLARRASAGELTTSSLIGAAPVDFNDLLPPYLVEALHAGLWQMDAVIPGFAGPDAVLLGPETRASGPVRIDRSRETRACPAADNLYPIGEGAGFAGGIISAAVDGLRSAQAVISRYAMTG